MRSQQGVLAESEEWFLVSAAAREGNKVLLPYSLFICLEAVQVVDFLFPDSTYSQKEDTMQRTGQGEKSTAEAYITNQIQIRNVQERMFLHFLTSCREWPGRVENLVIKYLASLVMFPKRWRFRAVTGILLTLLALVTLVHRTGASTLSLDRHVPFGFGRMWSSTEQSAVRFMNRARADYQTVWLAYSFARQLINSDEQPAYYSLRAKRGWEQCRLAAPSAAPQSCISEPAITTNQVRNCFRWQEAGRE